MDTRGQYRHTPRVHIGRILEGQKALITGADSGIVAGIARAIAAAGATVVVNYLDRLPHSSVQPLGFDGELIGALMPSLIPARIATGLGASHQAGWTGLIANLVMRRYRKDVPTYWREHDRIELAYAVGEAR
jgi:NAD(P)-dependent dehydrogenase (short-subunit alcohol dehydrogenase family)